MSNQTPNNKKTIPNNNKTIPKNNKTPYILHIKNVEQNMTNNNLIQYIEESKIDGLGGLSGNEPTFEPTKWNNKSKIKKAHNCYSYAINKIVPTLTDKAQPGRSSGYNSMNDDQYECKEFYNRLKKDNPLLYVTTFTKPCQKKFHKIFLALDKDNIDYHFYRQDNNGYWSHKPGRTEATNLDASGNKIKNPLLADRNYESYKYTKPCFFACVYTDLSKTMSYIY